MLQNKRIPIWSPKYCDQFISSQYNSSSSQKVQAHHINFTIALFSATFVQDLILLHFLQ